MNLPKVVLIGGPPFVGKSAVARRFAARYGYGCISTDDIGKAIGAVTTVETHPELHTMDDTDYRDYFTGVLKTFVFGMIIAIIGCYQGFQTQGGAEGVGRATTRSVVMSSILILIANYFLAEWIIRVWPI